MERKLTAILSADVEGYSRLMGDDEEATVKTLSTYREAMSRLIEEHQGRVVDYPGDNLLAEFTSAVNAVRCAVVIQGELRARNASLSEDRRMNYRIGINLGDVIVDGERIYGDGVNVAARVESLAEGGGICVSGTVYDQVANKLSYTFENRGEHTVKNIAEPVRVFAVRWDVEKTSPQKNKPSKRRAWIAAVVLVVSAIAINVWLQVFEQSKSLPQTEKPSIAVLPFLNMSPEKNQEYFSDGITEEIITALTRVADLRVASRTSSFRFKDSGISTIGEQLNVATVLAGSVRKAGNTIRIAAQLINVDDGFHLWSETYDRELKDIFAIQDEISHAIAQALRIEILGEGGALLFKPSTIIIEAYDHYLLGRYHWSKRTVEGLMTAIEHFEKAITFDPNYALAYSGLADVYLVLPAYIPDSNRVDIKARAIEATKKALAIDPNLAEAHTSLGFTRESFHFDYTGAEREYRRAIELNPKYAPAHYRYSFLLMLTGRLEEALAEGRKALELEPFLLLYNHHLGLMHYYARQYDTAIQQFERTLALDSNIPFAWEYMGTTFFHKEKFEDATHALNRWAELTDKDKEAVKLYVSLVEEHVRTGEPVAYPPELESVFPCYFYAFLGHKEQTLELLERYDKEEKYEYLQIVKYDPIFDFLQSEPRFIALMQKVGL